MARYRIDPDRSRVVIEASSSLHPIRSECRGLEGWLELDVQGGGRVNPQVPVRAHLELPVDELRSGNPLEERELKKRVDARKFPTITGDLRSLAETAEHRYRAEGDVTFRGVSRPAVDEVAIEPSGDGLRISGSSTFDVRDHGMEPPRILMLRVHPEVTVTIDLHADPEV